jgi:hypothetical protein
MTNLIVARIISLAKISSPVLSWIVTAILERFFSWLERNGIIFINSNLINFETEQDRKDFEEAVINANKKIKAKKSLTKEEIDAIDNDVIKAFDKFVVFDRLRDK